MLSRVWMTLAISVLMTFVAGCHRSERPPSVCELLLNVNQYNGKQIAVRGIYNWTTHGSYLTANADYNGSCQEVEKQGHTWPSGIRFSGGANWRQVNSKLEDARQLQRLHYSTKGMEPLLIVATFIGTVETRDNLKIVRRDDGSYQGNGYGPGGRFPAFLIPSDVEDITTRLERGILLGNLRSIVVIAGFVAVFLIYLCHCRRLDRDKTGMGEALRSHER
jgi:hypothetical protein